MVDFSATPLQPAGVLRSTWARVLSSIGRDRRAVPSHIGYQEAIPSIWCENRSVPGHQETANRARPTETAYPGISTTTCRRSTDVSNVSAIYGPGIEADSVS
jgi:hypothetical protein